MSIKNIILVVVVGILVFISAQNTQEVTLKLLAWKKTVPLIVLIYIIFFVGFLFGMLRSNIKHMLKDSKKNNEKKGFLKKLPFSKKDQQPGLQDSADNVKQVTSEKK